MWVRFAPSGRGNEIAQGSHVNNRALLSESGGAGPALLTAFVALLLPVLALAAPIKTQGTWYGSNGLDGTLRGRDAAGNPINLLNAAGDAPNPDLKYVYDTQLNLTWLADWNAGAASSFDNGVSVTDGLMTWANANAWAASLTDFGGGWTLPTVLDIGGDGCNLGNRGRDCGYSVYGSEVARRDSPLAHMFYDSLRNLSFYDEVGREQAGWGLSNTGPFNSMNGYMYWTSTAWAPGPLYGAWFFQMDLGRQADNGVQGSDVYFAVAVRPGELLSGLHGRVMPEPDALALLGLAVGALAVVRRGRDLTARDDTGGTEP